MYKNENSYIETKRKNSTTKIDDNSIINLFCFKSQKKSSKKYIKIKQILHETTNKKKSNRFSRITFFENKRKNLRLKKNFQRILIFF